MSLMYCRFCCQTQMGNFCNTCGSKLVKRGGNEDV